MVKFQKFEEKIRKYISKLEKLKKYIYGIGISTPDEFELEDQDFKEIVYPSRLGILFCGEFDGILFSKLREDLKTVYPDFFYEIKDLGEFIFSNEMLAKGIQEEYRDLNNSNDLMELHPTNKFYQVLINKRNENDLDMIAAITDLPIYSSSNNNIIFLFGEAHLKHRTSVISTLKLKEMFYGREDNDKIFFQRISKELIHELGHLILKVEHCISKTCVMRFSKSVIEIDGKDYKLCQNCTQNLNELRLRYNF